jgi:hypothetical protein
VTTANEDVHDETQEAPPFRVDAPGFYMMTAAQYHADPCPEPSLSSSIGWLLCASSAAKAWWSHPRLNPQHVAEEAGQFDLGNAAHQVVLEGHTRNVRVVEEKDWRTKAAQEARALVRSQGHLPLLRKVYDELLRMTASTRAQLVAHAEGRRMFRDGQPEVTVVWIEELLGGPRWCRARVDYLRPDGIDDYKTTSASANPELVSKRMAENGQAFQASFYQRGVQRLSGDRLPFRFAVQECEAPYLLSVNAPGPGLEMLADKQVEYALELWDRCLAQNIWPGYGTQTAFATLQPWVEAAWLEKEVRSGV